MPKKKPSTPRSRVRSALRMLFLRSRERNSALRREGNTCQHCHKKGSVAKGREVKIEVHHLDGVLNWDKLIDMVYEHLLCQPDRLMVMCKECHREETDANR